LPPISLAVPGLDEAFAEVFAELRAIHEQLGSLNGNGGTRYFNTKSAAVYLDTTEVGVRSLVQSGKLRPFRNGSRKYAFTQAMLDEYQQRYGRL
jgi:Helix-turn-helix domain